MSSIKRALACPISLRPPATQYFFSIPAIGLAILALIIVGDTASLGLAVALMAYLVALHFMVRQAYKTTMDGIQLQFENHDLVEELRAQSEVVEHANLAKSKFLAAASHDLRQPLHALGLFSAALRERVSHADTGAILGNIDRSVAALGELLDALLDLSKLDAGVVKAQVRDVSLSSLLDRLVEEYAPQAHVQGLDWHCRGSDAIVQTDPVLLETILRNLISNALRYTVTGSVGIDCRRDGDEVRIEVADTGTGIAPENHRNIFREFFQIHNPDRDRTKGLGLGLAIVERLVLMVGHRYELRSSPGEDTTFTLVLHAGDSRKVQEAIEPALETWAGHPARITVLVIDDEVVVREATIDLLEGWGYRVVGAASLEEALGVIEHAPDAIVADYRLHKPAPPGKLRAFLRSATRGAVSGA